MNIENKKSNKRLGNPMDYTPSSNENPMYDKRACEKSLEKTQAQSEQSLREADSGLGVPRINIKPDRILSAEETKAQQNEEDRRAREEAEQLLRNMTNERGAFALPKAIQRFFFISLLLLTSILCVMIITDTVQFFANIQSFSLHMKWFCIIIFVVFVCIILYIICMLFRTMFQLKRSPRIHLKALKTLAERQHLQKIAQEKHAESKKMLEKYLQDYLLTPQKELKFTQLGMSKKHFKSLEANHQELMEKNLPITDEDWCVSFQENFQSILDNTAKERIKSYAKRCALGTALMPFSLLDRIIVLYSCLSMIRDLLSLYHLKPSTGQSAIIFSKMIIAIYLSGILDENAELAAESFSDTLRNNLPEGTLESITGTIGTAINAKAAEAALNYFFINRLGKKTMQLLQPIIQ